MRSGTSNFIVCGITQHNVPESKQLTKCGVNVMYYGHGRLGRKKISNMEEMTCIMLCQTILISHTFMFHGDRKRKFSSAQFVDILNFAIPVLEVSLSYTLLSAQR